MLLSQEDGPNAHPVWYTQVFGAFIIAIDYAGTEHNMEFLWVHWFGVVLGHHWGFKNISKPALASTDLCRVVQTHRLYRKVSSNTDLYRLNRGS